MTINFYSSSFRQDWRGTRSFEWDFLFFLTCQESFFLFYDVQPADVCIFGPFSCRSCGKTLWNLLKCQPDNNCIIILRAQWRKVAGGGYKKPGLYVPVWYDIYSLATSEAVYGLLRFLIDAQNPSLRVKHGIISLFVFTVLEEWAAALEQGIDDQSLCGRTQRKQVLCEVSAQPRIPS